MAEIETQNIWITVRIDKNDERATLNASVALDGRSATAGLDVEVGDDLSKKLRSIIKDHGNRAVAKATRDLYKTIEATTPPSDEADKPIKV